MPTARMSPSTVSTLIEKPSTTMMASVPMSDTGIATLAIRVVTGERKKTKLTSTTRPKTISRVLPACRRDASTNIELSGPI